MYVFSIADKKTNDRKNALERRDKGCGTLAEGDEIVVAVAKRAAMRGLGKEQNRQPFR